MNYLVHIGCHLVTTCLLRHCINGCGRDRRMNIGGRERYGHIRADGREYVGRKHVLDVTCRAQTCTKCERVGLQHVPVANMYRAPTCRAPTCTGHEHVGCQHVPSANMSGSNIYWAPTCTRRQHVGHQHVPGTNMSGANMYQARTCRAPA
jgi:hypothetical protein